MIEFNIAPNTQIGRIDISNKWVVEYEGNTMYVKDNGSAYEFPTTEIDNKKVPKKINVYLDPEFTQPAFVDPKTKQPISEVEYIPEKFKTISYTRFYDNENIYHNPKYSRSGEFAENLVSDNIIEFCKRWLGLGGIKEILNDMIEYQLNNIRFYGSGAPYFGPYNYNINVSKLIECPLYTVNKEHPEKVLISTEENKPIFWFNDFERSGNNFEFAKSRVNRIYFNDN